MSGFYLLIVGAAGLLVLAGTCYGLVALAQYGLDRRADDLELPIEGPAQPREASRAWLWAVLSGGVQAERVKRHDIRKVLRRRYGRGKTAGRTRG